MLRPALPPSEALVLSLAAGLAVHSAVQQIDSGAVPDLKWPNDLMIGGKKFCGILTEMNAEADARPPYCGGDWDQREPDEVSA